MRFQPEVVLSLLAEVEVARKRAANADPNEFSMGERLDLWAGYDHAAANRFEVLAQAYRELLAELQLLSNPAPGATAAAGDSLETC